MKKPKTQNAAAAPPLTRKRAKYKIVVLGGGPAGLYSSLLLKKANPDLDITVLERNPSDATYGWGVVFSDRTLNSFREADYKSYKDITDQFVLWEAIDTYYKEALIRCGGHVFAGLARRELLLILQNRCRELEINLKFKTEVDNLEQLAGYDLIIAADGVNSLIRQTYAPAFKPSLETGQAKYIWYGTHKVFDSFTFIFHENEHGLFQAHCYPFEGQTSTFIVECAEDVWRRAGLDKAGEAESIAYCQQLFAGHLGGHGLMSNRSQWINFITVKNKTWRHKNIVLIGDSAHTAHFSIGSGTKLAMEDAIALANAFEQHGHDLETAFKDYEAERRPIVEILQAAAQESQAYFENVNRYTHLDPLQFTFHMLTRSGRITYDNLRLRDSAFSETVDRWFAETASAKIERRGLSPDQSLRVIAPPPMFAPLQLRDLSLANRVVLAPVSTGTAQEGLPAETHLNQLVRRARGGAALVMTEPAAVAAEGRVTAGDVGMYRPEHAAAWKKIVEAVHAAGAALALQLNHAGRRGATRPRQYGLDRPLRQGAWPLLAASAVPYTPLNQTPKAMDQADMNAVCQAFMQAARLGVEAGFDWLQLHFAHGYLLAGFISPLTNRRQDEYGGSLENRLRFPLKVFEAVRAVWPENKPISVALTATDWAKGGLQVDEAVEAAKTLKAYGCDLIEALAGQTTVKARPVYGPAFLAPFSEQIRNEAGLPTLVSGGITTTDHINSILAGGRADLCLLSPRHLND